MKSKPYQDHTPKEWLNIEPISKHYFYRSKEEIKLEIGNMEYLKQRIEARLLQLQAHHFEGRTQTNEMSHLKRSAKFLEEDIAFLKTEKMKRFEKKRGPKKKKRPAKRKKKNKGRDD